MRAVKVAANSGSLEEARGRVFDFFRTACRSIPQVMEIYNLHDVVTASHLRLLSPLRSVIDMLLFKGNEELSNIVEHAKQRHHIIGQYVVGSEGLVQDSNPQDAGISDFLKNFYQGNYYSLPVCDTGLGFSLRA